MEQFIGCDAHKKSSVFVVVNEKRKPAKRSVWLTIGSSTARFVRDCLHTQRSAAEAR